MTAPTTPRATYRFQFHKDFTFADAEALVPYLDELGISHLYASPITTARSGSTHGYDVVDPTRINPELSGEDAFRSLVAALRARDMGVIIDIVPNHMGVAGGENTWWNDVLTHGEDSEFARYFDIDWREKLVLPILGDPLAETLASGALKVEQADGRYVLEAYGEHRLPIRDEDQTTAATDDIAALIDRQHYRLASWRVANDELNWRRFFTINDLAGLRAEDPVVFEATHALYFRLYAEGLIDGVRVDHVDGLTDPAGYCRTLRARLDAIERPADAPAGPAYIVIEKILADGEPLSTDWGVDGTSGYDFMEQVTALLHAPAGAEPFAELWADISGRSADFAPEELRARQDLLAWQFDAQHRRCVEAFVALARSTSDCDGLTTGMLHRAIERLLWVFPVYRTYGTGEAAPLADARIRDIVRQRVAKFTPPGEGSVVDQMLSWLAGEGSGDPTLAADAVRRFQQLSAPIAAKAVEDTAFYRYGRLLSRNDVGFDAARMSLDIDAFHAAMIERAGDWPSAMLATATHDHKRGEDVRARLAVLSEIPDLWRSRVEHWFELAAPYAEGVDPADTYMLLQTLFGAWPTNLRASDADALSEYAKRIVAWQEKALREAKLRSSWEAPDEAYETRCHDLTRALLDSERSVDFPQDMTAFVDRIAPAGEQNSLAQVALRYTVPGVPDLYQGTEIADLSLVDPDNRRPVDYAILRDILRTGDAPKMRSIKHLLDLRRTHPALFSNGSYAPIAVIGPRRDHVMAFQREHEGVMLCCIIALRCAERYLGAMTAADWWGDTALSSGERILDLLGEDGVRVELMASDPALAA
ncbi:MULTISPECIES: malto-oligosyltrehalose synthase [unclassified Sphingomonas]|uniref:malto-oligosyltrehalose synthase n=1 Tax=unclassified Sphingomonas TaxID=196159 RepID=UPI000E725817|nr:MULTISPECIES: malto-oligosyltrehalose synthase [unclassified Sphingomonas]RKE53027.1 maltooligosyl trehalose synthase [Sphingomonas sp. PP-CC-1A-547]TCM09519.1 maltooligosyl trehalose synthase [Sphingomonas sp. PP-CC-3G-468]